MAKNKQELKVGDLVRVPGRTTSMWHGFNQGSITAVRGICGGVATLYGYNRVAGMDTEQELYTNTLKLAKQAMRKRDAYAARR